MKRQKGEVLKALKVSISGKSLEAKIHGEKGRIQIRLSGFSLEDMFCVIVSQKHSN